jgi:formylglycine-generating enzyme required for sulfatase activity
MTLYARWVPKIKGMVWVQRGSFVIGDNQVSGAKPAHKVSFTNGFYIGIYTVTQDEYMKLIKPNPSHFQAGLFTRPVDGVSWYDAIAYCNTRSLDEGLDPVYEIMGSFNPGDWASYPYSSWDNVTKRPQANGYRLPTEAEWEYAAKGGNGSPGNYIYSGSNTPDEVAWYNTTSGSMTNPVGQLTPNGLGIYDMSGNISEWCWDWYDPYYYSADVEWTDPTGPSSGDERSRRGGSWNNAYTNVRTVIRNSFPPNNSTYVMGFRVVRGAEQPPDRH